MVTTLVVGGAEAETHISKLVLLFGHTLASTSFSYLPLFFFVSAFRVKNSFNGNQISKLVGISYWQVHLPFFSVMMSFSLRERMLLVLLRREKKREYYLNLLVFANH